MNNEFLVRQEVLRARLHIRDFFLKNTVREVYENIGQTLSHVRMQLAKPGDRNYTDDQMDSLGHMVGQTIKDLRYLCNSFYPDADIVKDDGFVDTLKKLVKILYPDANAFITLKEQKQAMHPDLALIVFNIIREILMTAKEQERPLIALIISFRKIKGKIIFKYTGKPLKLDNVMGPGQSNNDMTIWQRVKLIKGKFSVLKNNGEVHCLKLLISQNCFLYA